MVLCCAVISFSFLSLLYQKLTSDHPAYLIEQNSIKPNRSIGFGNRTSILGLQNNRTIVVTFSSHGENNSPQSAFYTY